ncbi:rhodanese-like domain-containing protein [Runella sp. CRIBMP]|uniref:rhodanese-like domain-containing protein n=1 Tax=Runella sp. CRIBMP TaxID=2683261 RepID=UPI001412E422|nr:rhodanese-like domain-containing protein [Runella sp. CRIBMP]NBB20973.1 rhodanese-like domain-containing protein [Runella sp. CRIBMP]
MFDFLKTKKNYENVNASSFKQLIDETPNAVVLDVRTAAEMRSGAIKGAINIDLMGADFQQKIAKLDKSKTYFVYCRSGNRSGQACKMMGNSGFEHVYNLSGGMMSWPY